MEALNIKPSRTVGNVKDAVKEAILNGDIPNDHDAAFNYMMEHKDDFLNNG